MDRLRWREAKASEGRDQPCTQENQAGKCGREAGSQTRGEAKREGQKESHMAYSQYGLQTELLHSQFLKIAGSQSHMAQQPSSLVPITPTPRI